MSRARWIFISMCIFCARCVFIIIMSVLSVVCIYQYLYQLNIFTSCARCAFINVCTNNYMYVLCVVCIYQYMYQYMYILSDCLGVIYLLGVLLRLLLLSSSVVVCHYILFFSYSRTGWLDWAQTTELLTYISYSVFITSSSYFLCAVIFRGSISTWLISDSERDLATVLGN